MTRWINSKIEEEITDLQYDLLDGLVLVKLINKIIVEIADKNPQAKLYSLHQYSTIKNQPSCYRNMSNINDFLQFVQVVLKINICNTSPDNIVEGNLKLDFGTYMVNFYFRYHQFRMAKFKKYNLVCQG